MKKQYSTEQENFWADSFGDEYASRNMGDQFLANQVYYFAKIFTKTKKLKSVIEFGANIGINLQAIHLLLPQVSLAALEINKSATEQIKKVVSTNVEIFQQSIFDFYQSKKWDFVLVKGVLIHLNPKKLKSAYEILYQSSSRYICLGEYYNPSPVGIDYRGHKNKLFKRDFCGEMMNQYPDLKLINYGFSYHKDPNFPQDDINWFLLEKGD